MSVYDIITTQILAHLERGTIPWRQPWQAGGPPQNLFSQKPYRGVNVWLLVAHPSASPFWLTRHQAEQIGGHIRPGERGTPVVFWKPSETRAAHEEDKAQQQETRRILRYYLVWNTEQCDLPPSLTERLAIPRRPDCDYIETCEQVVQHMPHRPQIIHHPAKAYYVPATDSVHIPARPCFAPLEEYYATLFHELSHSTGHPSRLGRATLVGSADGSHEAYGKEELVAELGAAYLCGHCQIGHGTVANAAAYIQGWLTALRNDTRLVIAAAAEAQKAVEYILNGRTAG